MTFKSSLVQAILGELPSSKGFVQRSSSISYMSQGVWIFPGTIRDNILCGSPFNGKRYQKVLKITTLDVVSYFVSIIFHN